MRYRVQEAVREFNRAFPIGTKVRYWRGARTGPGEIGRIAALAKVIGGHTAVTWIEGCPGCIALTHIEEIPKEAQS